MSKRKKPERRRMNLGFSVDPFVVKRLRDYKRNTGVPVSKIIEFAVVKYLGIEAEFKQSLDKAAKEEE